MKKLISLVLVLVMVLSLSVTAFAADLGENKDVTAEYTPTATEPTKYTLTIQAAENGTVTAVPTEAAAGEKITLTVTPAEGYKLDTLAVKAGEEDVEVAADYTFVMPAADVIISATFAVQLAPTYDVVIDPVENGTVIANKLKAEVGEEVILTVTPAEGYELESLIVNSVNVLEEVVDGQYTAVMEETGIHVEATFDQVLYSITVSTSEHGYVRPHTVSAVMGEEIVLTVTPESGYELEKLTVMSGETQIHTQDKSLTEKTFIMPAADVTITATFVKIQVKSVEIVWGSMAFTYSDAIDETTGGEIGWSDDGSEAAASISVVNTGEVELTVSASYTAEEGYTEITGSFNADSTLLDSQTECSFILTLSGKPKDSIPAGTKIGSVTITIQ